MEVRLSELKTDLPAKVLRLEGGQGFQRRMRTRGIREGKMISLATKQPMGPLVVRVSGTQMTIGRGMAGKIVVQV